MSVDGLMLTVARRVARRRSCHCPLRVKMATLLFRQRYFAGPGSLSGFLFENSRTHSSAGQVSAQVRCFDRLIVVEDKTKCQVVQGSETAEMRCRALLEKGNILLDKTKMRHGTFELYCAASQWPMLAGGACLVCRGPTGGAQPAQTIYGQYYQYFAT